MTVMLTATGMLSLGYGASREVEVLKTQNCRWLSEMVMVIVLLLVSSCGILESPEEEPEQSISLVENPFTFAIDIRADGAIQLTNPPQGASDQNPAFSPDDHQVLFTRFENGYNEGPSALYLLDLASSEVTLLTSAPDSDSVNLPGSAWNAATNQITFSSDRGGSEELWTIHADGSAPFRVTTGSHAESYLEPSFSPEGDWIAFEVAPQMLNAEHQGSIWKVRADGSGLTQLTGDEDGNDDRQPNWSPAGEAILFQRQAAGSDTWKLYLMNSDGRNIRQVTRSASEDSDASWSADGSWVVYSSDYGELELPNLFIVSIEGGEPIRATYDEDSYDGAPSWSHDGRWLAFESHLGDEDAPSALWIIAAPEIMLPIK